MLNKTRFKRFTGKLLGSVVAFSMLGQSLTPIQIYGQDGVEDEFYEGDVGNGEDFATDESEMIPDNLPIYLSLKVKRIRLDMKIHLLH